MVVMRLCPNCKTIQKAGTICPLCKCPVEHPDKQTAEDKEKKRPGAQEGKAA